MRDQSRRPLRPLILLSCILLPSACAEKPLPFQLDKYCVSDSGMSKYWIRLDTSERTGSIRYQYMGQDVRYSIGAMEIDGDSVEGRADFQSSSTGEKRGTPIVFGYDHSKNVLNDGSVSATCQNNQG